MPVYKTMNARQLEQIRCDLDIAQQEFAYLLGISSDAYGRYLSTSGRRKSARRSLAILALCVHALGNEKTNQLIREFDKGD